MSTFLSWYLPVWLSCCAESQRASQYGRESQERYVYRVIVVCAWPNGCYVVRMNIRTLSKDFDKTEDDMKALQSVGQIIGEILKQLDDERCES